jgi:uncharacterized protein (DUF2062 family)
LLAHPTFFSVTRRSVAGAIWLGVFVALLPIPGQTIAALLAALVLRVNLPIAGITTWVTNPITMVPIFYWQYGLGTLLLDLPLQEFEIVLSWEWITDSFLEIGRPLLLGSFISATLVASTVYVLISLAWRWAVAYQYKRRHIRLNR